jgi:hypothetical protein
METGILLNVIVAPDVNAATLKSIIERIYNSHLAIRSVKIAAVSLSTCISCHCEFPVPPTEIINRDGNWRGLFCSEECRKNGLR